jgi:hypothetical protein
MIVPVRAPIHHYREGNKRIGFGHAASSDDGWQVSKLIGHGTVTRICITVLTAAIWSAIRAAAGVKPETRGMKRMAPDDGALAPRGVRSCSGAGIIQWRASHNGRCPRGVRPFGLLIAMGLAVVWGSARPRAQGWSNPVETARQFLLLAYPELTAHEEALMAVNAGGLFLREPWSEPRGFDIHLVDRDLAKSAESELLTATFSVPPNEPLFGFRASGPLVHTELLWRLKEQANAHLEWSDERLLALLRNAGAETLPEHLGDPYAVFESKALSLEPFIGAVTCESVDFCLRDPHAFVLNFANPPDESRHPARFEWVVQIRVGQLGNRLYILSYEPFEGKLVSISAPVVEFFGNDRSREPSKRP